MIKISAVRPPERCAQIIKWRQELAYEHQEKIRQWGLQVSSRNPRCAPSKANDQINKNLMKVPARILPPPSVMYARGRDARPNDGSWHLRGKEVSYSSCLMSVHFRSDQVLTFSSSEMAINHSRPGPSSPLIDTPMRTK